MIHAPKEDAFMPMQAKGLGRGEGGWDDDLSYRTFIETLYLGEGPSTGMIVILLRSENCRFWSHLGCLGWKVNIIVRQVLLRIPCKAKPDKKTNKQTNNAVLQHCVVRKHL